MNSRCVTLTSAQELILQEAAQAQGIRFIVGYGSRVHGRPAATEDSDFDVGVVDDQSRWSRERHRAIAGALREVWPGLPLDVVQLNAVDLLLRVEAVTRGVLLCGDSSQFYEYRGLTIRLYKDQGDLRRLETRLIEKKLDRLTGLLGG